ncbi:MAG: hypothetical protein WC279_10055 [Sulfurimonas sp.]|jgi:hypothetical protein|uniref:hypothetical protein n=1 Tax=Sulfurimonas sp. TaxID=2022749 RepID=UPI0035671003
MGTEKVRKEVAHDLTAVDRRLTAIEIQRSELQMEEKELMREKARLETLADSYYYCRGELKITEHAILRYLERAKGVDMQLVIEEMLEGSVLQEHAQVVGSGLIPIRQGLTGRVIDNILVTVIRTD